jgi:hypothetical protein
MQICYLMLETFIGNRNHLLLCFLSFVLTFGFLQAQDTKSIPDIEKVYLHTDNSRYFIGENLYYKAYNVNAYSNLLFDNSTILYVELISPDAKIIARNKTNIGKGIGHGDFQLVDSLGVKPGVYQLRAYTNWNRNFGEDFVFKKNIEIIDVFESSSKPNTIQNTVKETKAKTVETTNPNNFTVDFFPEGGSLLENVASIVGFKAVDNNGNPIEVKGDIFDSNNELVTSFLSVHDGMGKFQMIPLEGKKYHAKIKTPSGSELNVELPKVMKQGYSLSYRVVKGKNIISIMTNNATLLQNPNTSLTVVCKAKGVSYFESKQTMTQTASSFELAKDISPEGISQITLFDSNRKPQSERLVYIEKEQDLEVTVSTDKTSYKPNEKATVNVVSESKTGESLSASFSLSVTDRNGVLDEKEYDSNICSYFLLESDIRGKVINPGYYFDATNSKRLEHLDDLLLTQGWRDFVWKTMPKPSNTISYKAEKGFTISGRVKQLFGDKSKVNSKMSLTLANKKQMNFFSTKTDSIGRFQFENLKFSGKNQMYLNTRNENGKFRGEMVLDSIEQAPMGISFKNEPILWSETTKTVVENVFKKYTAFGVKPENILKEVKIITKNEHQAAILYGIPNYSYVPDKDAHNFNNMRDFIDEKMPQTRFLTFHGEVEIHESKESNEPKAASEPTGPLVLIDGYPITEEAELSFVNPGDVLKIEALIGSPGMIFVYGYRARFGIISIFTNGKNWGNKPKKEVYQSIKKKIEGFYEARVFYSPTPEQAKLDNIASVRNTLYWNPDVFSEVTDTTDTTDVDVSYYNTKVETKVKVALEGMTATGIPVVKTTYYSIQK